MFIAHCTLQLLQNEHHRPAQFTNEQQLKTELARKLNTSNCFIDQLVALFSTISFLASLHRLVSCFTSLPSRPTDHSAFDDRFQ